MTSIVDRLVFSEAKSANLDELVDFYLTHFITDEPSSIALGLNPDNARALVADIVKASFEPYGCVWMARDPNSNMQLVGARSVSWVDQDTPKAEEALPNYPWQSKVICDYLDAIDAVGQPRIPPHIRKYVKINMTCVRGEYQRQGVAQRLVDIINREAIKRGYQGVYTQATSPKSQALYAKNGWSKLGEVRLDSLNVRDRSVGDCKGMPFFKEF